MVGPKVAAAAAQRALEVLAEEDPAVAAEAAALQQATEDGQASDDHSVAPGVNTQHNAGYAWSFHAVVRPSAMSNLVLGFIG